MKKRLIGKINSDIEFDDKRFYFKGEIKAKCPHCKEELIIDFSENYISYPNEKIGEDLDLSFYCDECDKYYLMPSKLKSIDVIIEYDADKLTEEE